MRSKFTLLLLALNLALFGYLLISERPWAATTKIEENRRRVLGPEAANLAALEIGTYPPPPSTPGTSSASATPAPSSLVRLAQRDDTWLLTAPLEWPANDFAVRRILNELQFLENETSFLVSDLAASGQTLADYGLDHPRLLVTATPALPSTSQSIIDNIPSDTSPTPFTLKIGATAAVGGRLYVLSPDQKRVHVLAPKTSENLLAALTLNLAQLRSDQLFTIPVFEARALTLQSGAATASRTRLRRDQTRWLFESPITARAAKTPVELAINDLNALRVARFIPADSAPPAETTGLAAPRLRITLEGNARRETLHLGSPVPGSLGAQPTSVPPTPDTPGSSDSTIELYARLDWRAATAPSAPPVLFTIQVPATLLDTIEQAQTTLRDKRVLDLDPARVTAISVSAPAFPELRIQKLDTTEAWQIAAPAATPARADSLLVRRLLQRLQLLETARFASDAPSRAELENFGFNRPERIITLELAASGAPGAASTASEITLELAQPNPADPAVYARVTNQPFVYAVPTDTLDQFPVVPRFYRDRTLLRLQDGARITRLALRRADAGPDAPLLLDYSPPLSSADTQPNAPSPDPVATLLSALRELRAQAIVREDFPATTLVDGVEKPWAYILEATLEPAPPTGPLVLHFAERTGGSTQLAGSPALGLVFTLEQPVLDALWQLLYREPTP